MIIEYFLEYNRVRNPYGAICCGEFQSWQEFQKFEKLQNYYGKKISQVKIVCLT